MVIFSTLRKQLLNNAKLMTINDKIIKQKTALKHLQMPCFKLFSSSTNYKLLKILAKENPGALTSKSRKYPNGVCAVW